MKVIFMGTPDFAVDTMENLAEAGHQIVLAVTQPDKPKGRSGKPAASPVKEAAQELGVPVYQPEKVRDPACIAYLQEFQEKEQADIIVVVAFGQILPKELLDLCPFGCINVHASLLPAWRGAAPIQWAVMSGEPVSGVTTMQMDEGLDTGDILLQKAVELDPQETYGSLSDKLSVAGALLCVETLQGLADGTITPRKQDESPTPYASMIQKEMGRIDWDQEAVLIDQQIRGLNPRPGAYTVWKGQNLKIWEAEVDYTESEELPGTVTEVDKDVFYVQTGAGQLKVLAVQMPGKKKMDTAAFLRGNNLQPGTIF